MGIPGVYYGADFYCASISPNTSLFSFFCLLGVLEVFGLRHVNLFFNNNNNNNNNNSTDRHSAIKLKITVNESERRMSVLLAASNISTLRSITVGYRKNNFVLKRPYITMCAILFYRQTTARVSTQHGSFLSTT